MSAGHIRLVQADYDAAAFEPAGRPVQLSLFDAKPRRQVLCLVMRDLHGQTFARALREHGPQTILDLRSHPYFDLYMLGREAAFAIFGATRTTYRHVPLDLRPFVTQAERWRIMREAVTLFSELIALKEHRTTFALMVNRREEVPLVHGALTHTDAGTRWDVVVP